MLSEADMLGCITANALIEANVSYFQIKGSS